MLDGSRSDVQRLQQRLTQLVASWEADHGTDEAVETDFQADDILPAEPAPAAAPPAVHTEHWPPIVDSLQVTVRQAMVPAITAAPATIRISMVFSPRANPRRAVRQRMEP